MPDLRLSPSDADVAIWLLAADHPHGDELTIIDVRLTAPGLDAACAVESIGEDGFRLPFRSEGGAEVADPLSLSNYFRELAAAPTAWDGIRAWRSRADELRFSTTCDRLGHASVTTTLQHRLWPPAWSASATFVSPLGDLAHLADRIAAWFMDDARWP